MYTDIHILAYLQKRMTDAETADFERAVSENPELKENLEAMILAYLLHEHPDSAYSTTTPVSDDTRSFVQNLFDEIDQENDEPIPPVKEVVNKTMQTQTSTATSLSPKLLIAAALTLVFIITSFWYFSNPKNAEKPVSPVKDTIDFISTQDTNKVGSIENEPSSMAEKPAKPAVVPPKTDASEPAYNNATTIAEKLEKEIKSAQQIFLQQTECIKKCITSNGAAQEKPFVFTDLNTIITKKTTISAKIIAINEWTQQNRETLTRYNKRIEQREKSLKSNGCNCN